jgi:protease secretion system outer membrane protein
LKKTVLASALALSLLMVDAKALDLMNAYESALAHDPTFRAAVKDAEAGRANIEIGRAGLLPQLSASYYSAVNNSKVSQPQFGSFGGPTVITNQAYPSNNSYFQVTQALFNAQAIAAFRQGTAQANLAQARLAYNTQDLLIRVVQAYTDLLYARDQYSYAAAQKEAFKEQQQVNVKRLEKGEGTITDALETRAAYEMADAQLIEARDVIENNKRKLEAITGIELRTAAEVKPIFKSFRVQPLNPRAFELWKEMALASNPEILASQHNEEVARQDMQKNVAANYPVISAVATWGQQNSYYISTINQQAVTSSAGIQAQWALFNGGQTTGLISQSRANYEKSQAQSDEARSRVITELRKQYDTTLSSEQKVAALTRAVESASELTLAMRKSVRGGERINLDVLMADKGLATAQRDLAQAKYNYLLAYLRLKQQAGNLTAEDLQLVSTYFERDQNKLALANPMDSQSNKASVQAKAVAPAIEGKVNVMAMPPSDLPPNSPLNLKQ